MPKKKRLRLCLFKKGFYKKNKSERNGQEKELTTSTIDLDSDTNECVGTQTCIPGIDEGIQTEEFIKSDHDYCVNFSSSFITDDEDSSHCDLNTGCIDCPDNDVMIDAFIQDPDVIEYGEIESTSFQIVVQEVVDQLNRHMFSTFVTPDRLSVNKLYVHEYSAVEFSIELKSDFTCNVIVHRKPLSKSHEIWANLPTLFDRSSFIIELCERASKYNVCCGNYEEEFNSLVDISVGLSNNKQPDIIAYREGDYGAKMFSSTTRTVKCDLLSSIPRCSHCRLYRKTLQKRKYRKEAKQETKRLFNHTNYKHSYMSRENLIQKLTEQKSEIKSLQNELLKLKREFQNNIRVKGVKVKESKNVELKELMNSCDSDFEKAVPD